MYTSPKILILLIAILFAACTKNNDPAPAGKIYNDAKGTYVAVSNASWYLTTQGNGGEVHLKVAGTTNADKLLITAYGDGVQTGVNIAIGANHQFTEDVVMSFSATSRQTGAFRENAILTAYKESDTLKATLASGDLHY